MALSGTVVAQSARGTRRIPAEEFLLGYFTTSLAANEVITAVDWEIPAGRVGFFEVVRRPGDFAVLGAFVGLGADPHVTWFGAGGRARRFPLADWAGSEASRRSRLVELAGQLDLEPHEEYKRTMAVDVAMRAAKDAEGDDN